MYEEAQRPILIFGWGIHLANAENEAIAFAERTGIPVCLTWGAADLMHHDHPLRIGTFGTHGNKYANLAIQNADLVISVGSRLDTKATGFPVSGFAPKAKVVVVDIDQCEIDKFRELGRDVEWICTDAKRFLTNARPRHRPDWLAKINQWKAQYPTSNARPYLEVARLSKYLRPDDVIVSDTGCSLAWMMQAFKFSGQRFIHAFNQTPMGYGLPASIGAAFATGRRVICITGNGGLSVNVTEMATVKHHELPIKIILFENYSHSMCMQTQRQWLKGEYPATSEAGGLACPDFEAVAHAYGISVCLDEQALFDERWKSEPGFLQLEIDPEQGLSPQARFGCALEDQEPMLPREELAQIMEAA